MRKGQLSARRATVFISLLRGHNAAVLRFVWLVSFAGAWLLFFPWYYGMKLTPSVAILFALGGAIPETLDFQHISLQLFPLLMALFVWGKYLNNELSLRCQITLPKSQSVAIWYVSVFAGMSIFCAVLTFVSVVVTGLCGFFAQGVIQERLSNLISELYLLEDYVGSPEPLGSFFDAAVVSVLFFFRLMVLLSLQFCTWLISAKGRSAYVVSMLFVSASMFFPGYYFLPLGGTMFFSLFQMPSGLSIGIIISALYLVLLGLGGWLYCIKADWISRLNS